jgi:uncharacterized protein YtpQ (UPF0354 family)
MLLKIFIFCVVAFDASANDAQEVIKKSNLMLVVRTSNGANKPDPQLVSTGIQTFQDANGKKHPVELSHYEYLGDTHIRFVFDSVATMTNTTPEQFNQFGFTPEEAVKVAIANIYRDYGQPNVYELEGGIYQVQGGSPDFDSSYFLDESLWLSIGNNHKEGVVVAVPARDLLLFAPISDKNAVRFLGENVKDLFKESGRQGVSSALFGYSDGIWKVYQSPVSQP